MQKHDNVGLHGCAYDCLDFILFVWNENFDKKNGKFWLFSSYDIRDIAIFIVYWAHQINVVLTSNQTVIDKMKQCWR